MTTNNQNELFGECTEKTNSIIQLQDGELVYLPKFFDTSLSDTMFHSLLETIHWKQDIIKMYGKEIPLPRLSAWYGDTSKPYTYSGITMKPHNWTKELLFIKQQIEEVANVEFTSVLLNRYRNGSDYVGWHSDDEKELGHNPVIGSVNFGASRKFQLRRFDNHSEKLEVELHNGTYLLMKGATQHYWQHQVPKTTAKIGERLNLTFRIMY